MFIYTTVEGILAVEMNPSCIQEMQFCYLLEGPLKICKDHFFHFLKESPFNQYM